MHFKTWDCQIMATVHINLEFEPMAEKSIVKNYTFFFVATFTSIYFFAYINSMVIQQL